MVMVELRKFQIVWSASRVSEPLAADRGGGVELAHPCMAWMKASR